jgi:phenylalanyl-tRNA synthetase beta chain
MQPSWRQDVTREVDLIEEIARHHGLDKFPARLHGSKQPAARLPHAEAEDRLRERLIGLGYREIVAIPLVNEEEDSLFRPARVQPVRITNPLAEDASLLRSNGLMSMARAIAWNLNRGQRNVRLFEIGRAYQLHQGAPQEQRIVTIGATGLARQKGVAESEREFIFADLKGDLDEVGQLAGGIAWAAPRETTWHDPAQSGEASLTGPTTNAIGLAGKLAQPVADRFKLRQDVFLAEFKLDPFFVAVRQARVARKYTPISRFPSAERDFSLVLGDGTSFAAVRDAIAALNISEVTSVEAVDIYRGKNLPPGKFSLLARVAFQSLQTTLTEAQVNDFSARIVAQLEQKLGAALRAS